MGLHSSIVEHCSANAGAMGSNPVEIPNFFRVNLQLLKLQFPLRRSYLHLKRFNQFFSISFRTTLGNPCPINIIYLVVPWRVARLQAFTAQAVQNLAQFRCLHESA